jgi:peptidoglycan/LPS O-acetylase OafA/YrhL
MRQRQAQGMRAASVCVTIGAHINAGNPDPRLPASSRQNNTMRANPRIPCVDALKAIACLLIVSHHLAFYGPMSDTAYPLLPGLIDWLYQHGRIAVQVFFVTAGFLLAGKMAPDGVAVVHQPLRAIRQRYLRLVVPYAFALAAAILCAAIVRGTLKNNGVPDMPNVPQLLANIFLLQDLLGQGALSAGVWYVAIDFQLFACATLMLWACGTIARRRAGLAVLAPLLILSLSAVSMFIYNRNDSWDDTGLYFFGSYGLGILAYWVARRRRGLIWLGLLMAMVAAAMLVEYRPRIVVAGLIMLLLGLARRYPRFGERPLGATLSYLGRISYSIFLIHYPTCLLVNAAIFRCFPDSDTINALGMLAGIGLSVAAGALFFNYIESGLLIRSAGELLTSGRAGPWLTDLHAYASRILGRAPPGIAVDRVISPDT